MTMPTLGSDPHDQRDKLAKEKEKVRLNYNPL
jgi:hypothetical protein